MSDESAQRDDISNISEAHDDDTMSSISDESTRTSPDLTNVHLRSMSDEPGTYKPSPSPPFDHQHEKNRCVVDEVLVTTGGAETS
jgi:hypothetical protein